MHTSGSPLRPRARLLRTLGEELISNEVVAVIELVKNAYDADATRVLIRFVPPLEPQGGHIEVIDNGHGMNLKVVQTAWMEPGTPSKRDRTRSEGFKRRYLGQKGIGRFASARLADELEVISRRKEEPKEVYALFDWRQFDDEERYLDEVLVLWEERKAGEICPGGTIQALWRSEAEALLPEQLTHGTILRMSGLKQRWDVRHLEDLRRGLSRLVSPNLARSRGRGRGSGGDFEIRLDLPAEFSHLSAEVGQPEVVKHPHYQVRGTIAEEGWYRLTYRLIAEGMQQELKGRFLRVKDPRGHYQVRAIEEEGSPTDAQRIECGPLEIEFRVWDRDELGNVVQKTHSTVQDVRRDLDAVAGINIYRDNFRVLPYGEPKDDWLRLDLRRVQNPTMRLSNNQIYGVVFITADGNPLLRDQSNREGLDENEGLQDLRGVLHEVMSKLETMRYASRPREPRRGGKPVGGLFAGFDFGPLADYVAKQIPDDKKAKELIDAAEAAFGGHLKEIQTVLARYQRLATLGQLIDHVLHEGRQPIATILNEAEQGLSDTAKAEKMAVAFAPRMAGRFTTIGKQGGVLATAFRRMEPFGGRKRGRPTQLYLEEIIRDTFAVFGEDMRTLKVNASIPRSQTLVRVDPSEMQEVIINLLQNSLYWLQQVGEGNREIIVTVERKGPEHVEILFSDSGPGVRAENKEMIFEPYFSTKPDGVGLGLSIAGEIVSDYYNGSLELLDRGPLKGASFLITLRKRV